MYAYIINTHAGHKLVDTCGHGISCLKGNAQDDQSHMTVGQYHWEGASTLFRPGASMKLQGEQHNLYMHIRLTVLHRQQGTPASNDTETACGHLVCSGHMMMPARRDF